MLDRDVPAGEASREQRLGWILAECSDLLNAGREVDTAEVLRAHPDLAVDLAAALEALRSIDPRARDARPLGSLGDYRLLRQVGRGGMGVVYEAFQASMDRRVALKVLPPGVAADTRTFLRFMREARTAGKLNHPAIVSVHAMGVEGDTPYYAMEFVEGRTLAQVLDRRRAGERGRAAPVDPAGLLEAEGEIGPLESLRLAEAFAGAADGLQHAHSRGVIHRDLKPSNLILDGEGRLRILDFGLAQLEGQQGLTGSTDVLGTPLYMSPEQARARNVPIDHRTDIYSLGATLYEALTGQPPFRGRDHRDTLSQIIHRDALPPRRLRPRIPQDLETIVLKCLRKEPPDRYGTAEALAQDLRRFVRGDPIEARPQSPLRRLERTVRRHRTRIVMGTLALLLLVTSVLLLAAYRLERARIAAERYRERVIDAAMLLELSEMTARARAAKDGRIEPQDLVLGEEFLTLAADSGLDPPREAIGKLEEAKALIPGRPEAYYHAARAWMLLGDPDRARRDAESAARLSPGFPPARVLLADLPGGAPAGPLPAPERTAGAAPGDWDSVWLEAHEASRRQDWKAAAGLFRRLLAASSTREEAYLGSTVELQMGMGRALLEAGEGARAIESFVAARTLWPGSKAPPLLLGKAYYLKGDPESAEATFRALHDEAGERRDEVALWVAALYKFLGGFRRGLEWAGRIGDETVRLRLETDFWNLLGDYARARQVGREAIRKDPSDGRAHHFLAVALLKDRDTVAEGLEVARRAAELWAENPDTKSLLAAAYQMNGQREKAREVFLEAIRTSPREPRAYDHLGSLLALMGEFEEAERRFHQAIELMQPGRRYHFLNPYFHLAELLVGRGRLAEAAPEYERALAYRPDTLSLRNLGVLEKKLGRLPEARRHLARALEIDPRDPRTQRHLGLLLVLEGKPAEAIPLLEAAARGDPRSTLVVEDLADALEAVGRRRECFSTLLEALARGTRDVRFFRTMADLQWRAGRGEAFADLWDAAAEPLEAALELAPDDPTLLGAASLARAHARRAGDPERARALARRAVERTDRKSPDHLIALADAELGRGDAREAVRLGEEALRLPTARSGHRDRLDEYRRALAPSVFTPGSIDAALALRAGKEIRAAHEVPLDPRSEGLRAYLAGRLLEEAGETEGAVEELRAALSLDGPQAEVAGRLAACLRRAGSPGAAEGVLREALDAGAGSRELWDAWMAVCLSDLRLTPEETLSRLPGKAGASAGASSGDEPSPRADCAWLLGELRGGKPLRIDCGNLDRPAPDTEGWSRDRFFRGGSARKAVSFGVAGAADDLPYRDARGFAPDALEASYVLPLPPGAYRVTLHFAEVSLSDRFPRRFDVLIGGEPALTGHDPGAVGFATADRRQWTAAVEDGLLEIRFVPDRGEAVVAALEVERAE